MKNNFIPSEIIKKKRDGLLLSEEEISFYINGYTNDIIPDYQMSALLMAIFLKGMNEEEVFSLTKSMLNSGVIVDTSSIQGFKVDKHSTGGVGDKTSLILGPIVAAAGVYVPMISGRGLGHTGGTLDKLEAIPGFNTQQPLENFVALTKKIGTCFIGQTKDICPADKKMYALRDVTATVESIPLICASIMSKKLAEGIDGLVLDVKFGSGAFMKDYQQAKSLALSLMKIGKNYGKKVVSLMTSMDQPLGRFAGNALETFECLEIMSGVSHPLYEDTKELSLRLSAQMIHLSGKTKSIDAAYDLATNILRSKKALNKFEEMVTSQGGNLNQLGSAKNKLDILANSEGFLTNFNTEKIGIANIALKAGRQKTTDQLDYLSGIEFHKKIGDLVKINDPIYSVHVDDIALFKAAEKILSESFSVSKVKPPQHILIKEVLEFA